MFHKLTLHRFATAIPATAAWLEEHLQRAVFAPTGPTQDLAIGFVPPRAEHGALVEAVGGHWIARAMIETRKVPSDALQRRIDEMVAAIEQNEGRKPGRKERRDLRDAAVLELMPQAFPKRVAVNIWIQPAEGLLAIESTSTSQIDAVITELVRHVPDLSVHPLNTQIAPVAIMNSWLLDDDKTDGYARCGFDVGRACELHSLDEMNSVVRYKNHHIDTEEVRQHIRKGMYVTSLDLRWGIGRVSFVLTEGLQLKKIEFLDAVFEDQAGQEREGDDFDANVAIVTGELSYLIADLIEALGGLMDEAPAASESPAQAPAAERKPITDEQAARMAATAYNPDGDGIDPLIDRARGLVVAHQKASISFVQRHLQIGYNRAARLLEALEVEGTVSPMTSAGVRDVLVKGGEA